jgi:tryptophanyl-tRNA synthetase
MRILTGVQSSGKPHLGNVLGAIKPALALGASEQEAAFFFIADLHSLTSVKDAEVLKANTLEVARAWLACGLDLQKDVFYRQSMIPIVTELTWYLSCFTPFPMLANAHSFKDKSTSLADVNAGLFTYPVLMAADILLYDSELVPVGRDQKQHLEIARDIADAVNAVWRKQQGLKADDPAHLLVPPESLIQEDVQTIAGTDGRKMSKSYGNIIGIFEDEKTLLKQVRGIVTDSTPVEEPKNPDTCNLFAIYRVVATAEQTADLRQRYLAPGLMYGKVKDELYEILLARYAQERERHRSLDAGQVEELLQKGEKRAYEVAMPVLERVRKALGFGQPLNA